MALVGDATIRLSRGWSEGGPAEGPGAAAKSRALLGAGTLRRREELSDSARACG